MRPKQNILSCNTTHQTLNGCIHKVTDFTFDRPTTVVYLQHDSHPISTRNAAPMLE